MIITAKISGKWMKYPHYDVPAINYKEGLLFIVYDNECLKFIHTDKKYNIIELKYLKEEKISHNTETFITAIPIVEHCSISDERQFIHFPPKDCLKDNVIFTIWFGTSYTDNRDKQFQSIVKNSGCKVININQNNIHLLEYPLHKSFTYLSSIHKADYLRCYLMYYYGGGYSDLKSTSGSWVNCFSDLKKYNFLYSIGYKCDDLPSKNTSGEHYDTRLSKQLHLNINKLNGVGFFIFKRNNSLINEWFSKLNEKLDFFYEKLKENPAKYDRESACGCPVPKWEGGQLDTKYPIHWNTILGYILYPIYLKHIKNIRKGIPNRNDNNKYK